MLLKGQLQRKYNLISKCRLYRETSWGATFRQTVASVAEKTQVMYGACAKLRYTSLRSSVILPTTRKLPKFDAAVGLENNKQGRVRLRSFLEENVYCASLTYLNLVRVSPRRSIERRLTLIIIVKSMT